MDTAIEITATPTDTPPSDTKPDMKKMLAEKVIMMAVKLGATPETVAMLKKDCGISEDKPTETKPTVEKPKAPDDLMEMMKQMSNR